MKLRPSLGAFCAVIVGIYACGSGSSTPATVTSPPPPPGVDLTKVVSVTVSPSTVSGGLATTVQYSAVQKNANGDPVAGQAISWTSSDTTIVTISGSGVARGVGIGNATITATSGTVSGTAPASIMLHPNEPSGLTRFAEEDFAGLPALLGNLGTLAGNFYHQVSPAGHFALVTDPTALQSPTSVLQVDFESGTQPGYDVGTTGGFRQFGGWDQGGVLSNTEYSEYYESTMLKIPTADFETQSVGVKILGYWGVDANNQPAATGPGPVQLYAIMRGAGSTKIMSSWNVDMYTQGISSTALPQNKNLTTKLTAGTWHQFETYMKLNTIGQSNGIWKWWLDGVLIGDYENMQFINSTKSSGFWGRSMNLVWGGQGGTPKTRTDYIWFNRMYMSGTFLRAAAPCGC
jgi:hypothetical protein